MAQSTFVGRTREMAVLRRELDQLHQPGAMGRLVVISADPGVGKTRLLQEAARRARDKRGRPTLVLAGRGSPLTSTIPLAILTEPLAAHFEALPAPERKRLPDWPLTTSGDRRSLPETFAAVRRTLSALGTERPVVLVLDDLHLADTASWDLLAYLGRIPPTGPVLVLAALRVAALTEVPELAGSVGALVRDGAAEEVRLASLRMEDVAELAGAALGPSADDALVNWLYQRASGNALLTVAMLVELAAKPSAPLSRDAVPVGVAERVRQLRSAMPAPTRRALDFAAVLGHPFDAATMTSLIGTDTVDALDALVQDRLLVEHANAYDFVHPLMQEAVYSGLGAARRRELHEQVGRAVSAAPLAVRAYHVGRGGLPGDMAAVALLREAASEAIRVSAPREALAHLSTALSLTPPTDRAERRALLDEIAAQAAVAPDHEAGIAATRELIALDVDDPLARARTHMRLASFLSTGAADVAAAETAATQAVDLVRESGSTVDLAAALNERAWIRGMAGDYTGQLDGCRETLALIGEGEPDGERSGDHGRLVDAATDVVLRTIGPMGGVLALIGDFDGARRCHARGSALAAATGEAGQVAWHAAMASLTETYAGAFQSAARIVDPIVDPAPHTADIATPLRTLINWFLGWWQLGRRDCAAVRELFPVVPSAHMAWSLAMGALFGAAVGAPGSVESWTGPAQRAYGDRDVYYFNALCRWALGCRLWLSGEPAAALSYLRRSHQWLCNTGAVGLEGLLIAELAEALVEVGDIDEAQAIAKRANEVGDQLGTPFAKAQAAYTSALVHAARGHRADARDGFGDATAGYASSAAPFLQARAIEKRAKFATTNDAVAGLTEAARLYASLPAPGCRDRVLARMRAGSTAGRRAAQQVGALTPREREIALLAGRGLPTGEIASRLHLSDRTVETHLGRVYRKLGIDGRSGLARALQRIDGRE